MLIPLMLAVALADEPLTRHQDLAEAAMQAERTQRPDEAIALCLQAMEALPDGPRAPRCRKRIAFLEARRDADGTFAGWIALETARAGFATRGPDAVRADVAALVQREGLAGPVLAEAEIWLALDDLDRRHVAEAALASTDALYARRQGLDPDLRALLVDVRSRALARLGRTDEARAVEAEIKVAAPAPRPTPVDREVRRQRDDRWTAVAWATLAAFVAASLPGVPAGLASGPRPWGLVPLGLAGLGGWLIARSWEPMSADAAPWMLAGFVVVHLLAVLGTPPQVGRVRRVGLGLLAGAATLAVAWLALASTHTTAWVGL